MNHRLKFPSLNIFVGYTFAGRINLVNIVTVECPTFNDASRMFRTILRMVRGALKDYSKLPN